MAGNNGEPQPGGIREVARLAGVSVASASFALNGQPGVAEPTRRRILAAAKQLGAVIDWPCQTRLVEFVDLC
jgi:hypothetical protein